MTTKEEIISNIYHDLETGYGSIKNTYEQASKKIQFNKINNSKIKWHQVIVCYINNDII